MLGLPDIEPLQQEVMKIIRDKTLASIDANDPTQLIKLFMPSADQFKSMESLQTPFWEAIGKSMDLSGGSKDKK